MKKRYWVILIILILLISPLILFAVFYSIFPYYPPFGGCQWMTEKYYNISVNNQQEAANLINDYHFTLRKGNWENITAEEINVTGNEFKYKNGPIKIDNNGRLSFLSCPV
jgi:hypothetical protein